MSGEQRGNPVEDSGSYHEAMAIIYGIATLSTQGGLLAMTFAVD